LLSVFSGTEFLGEIRFSHAKIIEFSDRDPQWWELKEKAEEEAAVLVGFIKITTHYKVGNSVLLPQSIVFSFIN
jgi:hypothetical protein